MKKLDFINVMMDEVASAFAPLIQKLKEHEMQFEDLEDELKFAEEAIQDQVNISENISLRYVIVRSHSHGVSAGYLQNVRGDVVKLLEARRIWFWKKAATLSELAITGPKDPANCKFPPKLEWQWIRGWCEIIPVTSKAQEVIESVPDWTA